MFLLKLFYFLKGYVIIDIIGKKGARILPLAKKHNIHLWNVTPSRVYCKKRDIERLLKLFEDNFITVKSVKDKSLSGALRKGAGAILICASAVCLLLVISSGYVWEIEVNGCTDQTAKEVLAVLEQKGLTVGTKKRSLPDETILKDSIIYNIDGINWAWVYFDGILARVEVSYKPLYEPIADNNEPCNITAVRDGVIVSVSALSGRKSAALGQTVSEGDILISGAMPGSGKTLPYWVHAEGEVLARTVHTMTATVPLTKTYTADTGEVFVRRTLRIFDLELPLGFKKSPDFTEYRVEKSTPPIGICTYRYIGTEMVTEPISAEAAAGAAADSLSEQIAKTLPAAARKTDEELKYTESGGFLKVTLTMHFIENIGIPTKVEMWQMEELTNDKTD